MKPNDENGNLFPFERPVRVFIVSASDRRLSNCTGVDSKSRTLSGWLSVFPRVGNLNKDATSSPKKGERDQ